MAGPRKSASSSPTPPLKVKDEDLLSEMIFGSIPVPFAGITTKIHESLNPPQLVLTLMFNGLRFEESSVGRSPPESPARRQAVASQQSIMARHRHFFEEQLGGVEVP